MATIQFTSAPSGTGKTFQRCARFLADEWLPNEEGVHYSNFPIFTEKMIDFVMERHPDMHRGMLEKRVQLIPADVMDSWKKGLSGPWEYFQDFDLNGAHIAIDEIHNFVNASSKKEFVQRWMEWAGEVQHRGCTVEFLSQHETKVHSIIRNEASLKRYMFNGEDRRDPWLKVKMGDWYNLRAKFLTGKYRSTIFVTEQVVVNGKWKESHTHRFVLGPPYFALYDSYSAPIAGGRKADGKKHAFETRGRLRLLGWFLARNWETVIPRLLLVAAIVLALANGTWLMKQFFELMGSFAPKKHVSSAPAAAAASRSRGCTWWCRARDGAGANRGKYRQFCGDA